MRLNYVRRLLNYVYEELETINVDAADIDNIRAAKEAVKVAMKHLKNIKV